LKRLAKLGFKQGGRPGYGLRRLLVSPNRIPKQMLATGERKSIATDRVILAPGPQREVECVREIFRLLIDDGRTVHSIARILNRRRIEYTPESQWDYQAVIGILTHPKYAGCHVFARTASRLYTHATRTPRSDWVVVPDAFELIVDQRTFERAQEVLRGRTYNKTNTDLLEDLRRLLASEGRLSLQIVKRSPGIASPSTYRKRFGSLRRAYELIGYGRPEHFGAIDLRRRTLALRDELISRIVRETEGAISVVQPSGRWRSRLRMPNGRIISLQIVRAVRVYRDTVRWIVDAHPIERRFAALVARLNEDNSGFLDFHVVDRIERLHRFRVKRHDPWLEKAHRIRHLAEISAVVERIAKSNHP
jgi:hypothetical protein